MMYVCPTTHPTSDAVNIVSPGWRPKTVGIEKALATAYPPESRTMPFGLPVVPEV